MQQSLYPTISEIEGLELLCRSDTRGVLEHYVIEAHRLMNIQRSELTPERDLEVMCKYWRQYHDG